MGKVTTKKNSRKSPRKSAKKINTKTKNLKSPLRKSKKKRLSGKEVKSFHERERIATRVTPRSQKKKRDGKKKNNLKTKKSFVRRGKDVQTRLNLQKFMKNKKKVVVR